MSCNLYFNEKEKKIIISSQTICEWTCIVMGGNITLNKYYGTFTEHHFNEEQQVYSVDVRILTYDTQEMYGTISCHFKTDTCIIKKEITINNVSLPFFYSDIKNVYLFGEDTKYLLYLSYGSSSYNEENMFPQLSFIINDSDIINYDGEKSIIYSYTYMGINLYDIYIDSYDNNTKDIGILFKSKSNLEFNNVITISLKQNKDDFYQINESNIEIKIKQEKIQYLPSLLRISPSFIFLDSINNKQKINVISLYNGENCDYEIKSEMPVTNETQDFATETEAYLNDKNIVPYRNDDLIITSLTVNKKSNYFILDMSSCSEEDENVGQIAYELYVVNKKDKNQFKKLEFFYDYIVDPDNFITIGEVKGIYAYVSKNNDKIECITVDDNTTLKFDNNKNSINLFFTKNKWGNDELKNYPNTIFAQYKRQENIIFTINSQPNWWKIYTFADYVKEVKQDDKLLISLEEEIPSNSNTYVQLQNNLGKMVTIFIKNEENIFNKTQYYFGFGENGDELNNQVDAHKEIFFNINETVNLFSYSTDENIYYIENIYSPTFDENGNSDNRIIIPTLQYGDINGGQEITIVDEYFDILYNQDIDKFFIEYSPITFVNGTKEKSNKTIYYFESSNEMKKINVTVPIKTNYVPWRVINNGTNITFNIYKGVKNKEKTDLQLINDNNMFFPKTEKTVLNFLKHKTTNITINEGEVYLIPNIILNDITDISTIIFQQLTTSQESYLYIRFENNAAIKYINKYGDTNIIDNMKKISYSAVTDAYLAPIYNNNNVVCLQTDNNSETALYYASYKKITDLKVENNPNINFYVVKEYDIIQNINIDSNLHIDNHNNNNTNYTLYSGLTNVSQEISQTKAENMFVSIVDNNQKINYWKISDGEIYIYKNSSDNEYLKIFPSKEIYYIQNNKTKGILILENKINDGSYLCFALVYNNTNMVSINNKEIEIWNNEGKNWVIVDSPFELIPKTITLNNEIIKIGRDNNFLYEENGVTYYCYEKGDKWYINLPSMKFILSGNTTSIQIQDTIITEDEKLFYTYNDIMYYPQIQITIPKNFLFNILESVDGGNRKEKFLIINDKKYTQNLNDEISLTPFITYQPNSGLMTDFNVNLINKPFYKYVIIDGYEYQLINEKLIYDGNEYAVTKINEQEFIIIGNNGYVVYTHDSEYYLIINNEKYIFDKKTQELKIKKYNNNLNIDYEVEELINETFRYKINMNNLFDSSMINPIYVDDEKNEYVITNGYLNYDSNYYPINKEFYIENANIKYKEYVQIPKEHIVNFKEIDEQLNLYFYDQTELLSSDDNFNQNALSGVTNVASGTSIIYNITEDITVTINDYSSIKFNTNTLIKFETDSIIRIKKDSLIKEYEFKKNELLIIPNTLDEVIFIDVTTITFIKKGNLVNLYVFNDIVFDEEKQNVYFSFMNNGQNAIKYDNNIFYIHNQIVNVIDSNNENVILNVLERCVLLKQINDITLNIDVIFHKPITNSIKDNVKKYSYIKNNEIFYLSNTDYKVKNIKWKISLLAFNLETSNLMLKDYVLSDFKTYNYDNNKINYTVCTIKDYCNVYKDATTPLSDKKEIIIVENGKFNIDIDCYKVLVYRSSTSGDTSGSTSGNTVQTFYTKKTENYMFNLDDKLNYSMWDYYANTYVRKGMLYDYSLESIILTKEVIINDVTLNVDENQYFEVPNKILEKKEFLKIRGVEWFTIDTEKEQFSLPYWDISTDITIKYNTVELKKQNIYIAIEVDTNNNNVLYQQDVAYYINNFTVFKNYGRTPIETLEINENSDGTYSTSFKNKTYVGINIHHLRALIDYDHYKTYDIELKENKIEVKKHSKTFLNANNEIQVATPYAIYDDDNEQYEFYCIYNNEVYNVNFGIVTLPIEYDSFYLDNNKLLVLFDINSHLMHNIYIDFSNETYNNNVRKMIIGNKIDVEHIEDIIIESKFYNENIQEDTVVYGKYNITLK